MQLLLPYEVWRDVKGYEGLYQISARGRVKSLPREWVTGINHLTMSHSGKMIKPRLDRNGYLITSIYKFGKGKTLFIHRLMAIHFLPNPENKSCVNHLNGSKLDNRVENFEWCTIKENNRHAWKAGLNENVRKSVRENVKKATNANKKRVIDLSTGRIFPSAKDAAKHIGMKYCTFKDHISGRRRNSTGLSYIGN